MNRMVLTLAAAALGAFAIVAAASAAAIVGTPSDDILTSTRGDDQITALAGSDYQAGILRGVLVRISQRKGVRDYTFTTG